MLYEHILSEYQQLDTRIQSLQSRINTLPRGTLNCCHHGKYAKWFHNCDHQKTYIPKSNSQLAEQLATKKYLSLLLEDLENERRALAFYLKHHVPTQKSEQLLTQPSEYQRLLAKHFSPVSDDLVEWMNTPYDCNSSHHENLIYKTVSGGLVRSKSELLIDMCLRTHSIPFRYECALHLDDTVIYPDFTIKHPVTHETYYWEHFGMMDNPAYINNATSKLRLYASHNILPGTHLITTYETKDQPLNMETVTKTIAFYF